MALAELDASRATSQLLCATADFLANAIHRSDGPRNPGVERLVLLLGIHPTAATAKVYAVLSAALLAKAEASKPQARMLLAHLASTEAFSQPFLECIKLNLSSTATKRDKLGATLSLECIIAVAKKRNTPLSLHECVPFLAQITESDALRDNESGHRIETRLTLLAATNAFDIVSLPQEPTPNLAHPLASLLNFTRSYVNGSRLLSVAMDLALECLDKENVKPDLIHTIATAFHPNMKRNSTTKCKNLLADAAQRDAADASALIIFAAVFAQRTTDDFVHILSLDSTIERTLNQILIQNVLAPPYSSAGVLAIEFWYTLISGETAKRAQLRIQDFLICLDKPVLDTSASRIATILDRILLIDPIFILSNLFSKVDSGYESTRGPTLSVFSHLARILMELPGPERAQLCSFGVFSILADQLIARLEMDELWATSLALFRQMDASMLIPKLCRSLDFSSSRSLVSENMLASLLSQSSFAPEAWTSFLEFIRSAAFGTASDSSTPSIKTPTDIRQLPKAPHISVKDSEATLSHLIELSGRIAAAMNPLLWPTVIPSLLAKSYGCPEDAISVRFIAVLTPHWTSKESVAAVLASIMAFMSSQPRLTEDLVDSDELGRLLFARLNPLLILKMIPISALDAFYLIDTTHQMQRLLSELGTRIESLLEYDKVGMLSAEVLAHLPVAEVLPLLVRKLKYNQAPKLVASYLYTACHLVSAHSSVQSQVAEEVTPLVMAVLVELLRGQQDDSATEKLQMGCIEYLALCVQSCRVVNANEFSDSGAKIQEIESDDDLTSYSGFDAVLYLLLDVLAFGGLRVGSCDLPLWAARVVDDVNRDADALLLVPALSTTMANVLTTCVKRILSASDIGVTIKKLRNLARVATPSLNEAIQYGCDNGGRISGMYSVAAASLQTFFHFFFSLKDRATFLIADVVDACLISLRSKNALVQMTALKVLGAALSLPSSSFQKSLNEQIFSSIKLTVDELATSTLAMSVEVKELACKISDAFA
ncbi:hypothetical protein BC830DRAFT_1086079 [Chytriomyces sp. MP71]|nr:hypothetical protein BC830DRAFT_1086079 [Chytriomyces sp. MP71]